MSFPRAKIQRFNDVSNSVPSPTKYDPKSTDKVKGGLFPKGERDKQAALSDTASNSTGKSVLPVFRTPQLPRKHNCLSVEKSLPHSAFKSITFKADDFDLLTHDSDSEEVQSLRIECSNKSETIVDLEKHIQDLKTQIADHEILEKELKEQVDSLETAKANFECIKSNNENYEQQIRDFEMQVTSLRHAISVGTALKDDLILKMEEAELKVTKLEESNLDYERKIISLEGMIEQVEMEQKNKDKVIEELRASAEKNHFSVECLQGKISTMENELKDMETVKSKNEATIFGLETQISDLNCEVAKLVIEGREARQQGEGLRELLMERDAACKLHYDTITGLDMQLGEKSKELQKLVTVNANLREDVQKMTAAFEDSKAILDVKISELTSLNEHQTEALRNEASEKELLLSKLNELEVNAEVLLADLEKIKIEKEDEIEEVKKTLQSVREDNKNVIGELEEVKREKVDLVNSHAETIMKLQNEHEMNLLSHMQESNEKQLNLEAQILEKDVVLQQANKKHQKMCSEYEKKIHETEVAFQTAMNGLTSENLEEVEKIKEDHEKKMKDLEVLGAKTIEVKNREIDVLTQQYKELLEEMKELIKDVEKKDEEMKRATDTNDSLNTRLKMMLEEIKLVNKENEDNLTLLKAMSLKYESELAKNEKLSEQLGELDSKMRQIKDDFKDKVLEKEKLLMELRKSKEMNDSLRMRKIDLELTVVEQQDRIDALNSKKVLLETEMKESQTNLNEIKQQCRNFEIVMADTRKSLEALGVRLIESENEVERLNKDNASLKSQLTSAEHDKNEMENENRLLIESKSDLEMIIGELEMKNVDLNKCCDDLESKQSKIQANVEELETIKMKLEAEKESYEKNRETLTKIVKQQEAKLEEMEKSTLEHVDTVSKTLMDKLDSFQQLATENIQRFTTNNKKLLKEKSELEKELEVKVEEMENLVTDHEILKTTFEITLKESEKIKKHYEEQSGEFQKLQKEVLDLGALKAAAEASLASKVGELSLLEELSTKKSAEVDKLTASCEEEKSRCAEVEAKVADLEITVTNLEGRLADSTKQNKSFKQELLNIQQNMQRIEESKSQELEVLEKEKMSLVVKLELEKKNSETKLEEAKQHMKEKNEKMYEELLAELKAAEERKEYYKLNCRRMDMKTAELMEENKSLKNDFEDIHNILKGKEEQLTAAKKYTSDLESLIGPFREQLEQYETERMFIESDREHLRKQHLEQAAKLGHQNHKQKIQHVVKLKGDLLACRKDNEKLVLEVKNLKKTVEKLREETGQHPKRLFIGGKRPSSTPFKGKENSVLSPNVTPMAVKQEPMSPSNALRHRNQ